jgi:hypothetical protein
MLITGQALTKYIGCESYGSKCVNHHHKVTSAILKMGSFEILHQVPFTFETFSMLQTLITT